MNLSATEVRRTSQCTIFPDDNIVEASHNMHHFTPWDLSLLSIDYIQVGLLFVKPQTSMKILIDQLKTSLSRTVTHFPTLLGCLVTKKRASPPSYTIYLDCTQPQGAEFIHATTKLTISDIISPNKDVPDFLKSFFPFPNGALDHGGHTKPLLIVQVTELVDGIFIACSINHSIVDGTSYWHFFNTWSEVCRENTSSISRPAIIKPWFSNGQPDHIITLPYSHHSEFLKPFTSTSLRIQIFHFCAQSILALKRKANAEGNTNNISSYQALNAFVWRSITRARKLALDQETCCALGVNDRCVLNPALSNNYFATCIEYLRVSVTVDELLRNNLGWSARLLNMEIAKHTNEKVQTWLEQWEKNPIFVQWKQYTDIPTILMQHSPRFDVYGNDFGWGEPLGARGGDGNRFDGSIISWPGREEKGSIDLEISLSPKSISALLLDGEFMNAVSPQFLFGKSHL